MGEILNGIQKELNLANRRIIQLAFAPDSRAWRLAVESGDDGKKCRIVGVESDDGAVVTGNCTSDVSSGAAGVDARFIAMFDPALVSSFRDLFHLACEENPGSPLFLTAYQIAVKINKKWDETEALLNGES